jgi:DHA2 family multidrug resistance protein
MLATFMEVLDTSIASVAPARTLPAACRPPIRRSHLGADQLPGGERGHSAGQFLVLAEVWPQTFPDHLHRNLYRIVVSLRRGDQLWMILLARAVQGAGGGALQPLSQSILLESFPPEKRGMALAVFALGVVVAPVLGPTLGGYLTDTYSWRWAFYINIPIGISPF